MLPLHSSRYRMSPASRRSQVNLQCVIAAFVVQAGLHLLQVQRQHFALRITPANTTVADFKHGLFQQPRDSGIGRTVIIRCSRRFATAIEQHASNVDAAIGTALRLHAGRNNSQTGKTRTQQTANRYTSFNARDV